MTNIRFEYLYRDAGNFKNWGALVFANPHNITAEAVTAYAENVLIDRTYFVASKACVPDLHFADPIEHLDHDWHEFHSFQPTDETPNDSENRDIEQFVEALRSVDLASA